ncbi:MAG TPA: hypothetical protein PKX02_06345 [Candidatus Sabulitectum sp.]|nr:hypothetical protein [Candidatus Sabulitectum sp.]
MVTLLLWMLISSGMPFTLEAPEEVSPGETFTVAITTTEPGCTGITTNSFDVSQGLSYRGSSVSTSISSIVTQSGRQLSQVLVYGMNFTAVSSGVQSIGPITVNLNGLGTYEIDEIEVLVTGSVTAPPQPSTSPGNGSPVWLEGHLRDPGGRIYPGTRLLLDYYVYARVGVENVSYWWTAPELGVIRHVETIPDSNWEGLGKRDNSSRSRLAVVEMTPAAPGSLQAPVFSADITGTGFDPWGKSYFWSVQTDPLILPVYPFPGNPPVQWDGTLLDSVSVRVEQLPSPPGQGGELALRVTCMGPGRVYMEDPPELTLTGNSSLIPCGQGEADNKKWWDFILEPDETGCHITGPDTLVWLDRTNGTYRMETIEPCTLEVSCIPWSESQVVLQRPGERTPVLVWILAAGGSVLLLTVILGAAARRRDRKLASVTAAEDLDELLTGLENELSLLLAGRREYLGFEELDDFLNECDTDSLLARRILRFWKDLENSIGERELSPQNFDKLKKTAGELLAELKRDLDATERERNR